MPRDDFVAAVRSYVGTPFSHRGRTPGVALDCAGVVVCALASGGIASPDIRYGMHPTPAQMSEGLQSIGYAVPVDDRRTGDLLTMHVHGLGEVHMAVLVEMKADGSELIVHPSRRQRIVETTLSRGYRLASCWRLREVM